MAHDLRYRWRREVTRDGRLTHMQLRVLMELESYADPDGTNARPGVRRIAESLETAPGKHAGERTVRIALQVAVELGYIECTTQGRQGRHRNSANVYSLRLPAAQGVPGDDPRLPAIEPVDNSRLPAVALAGSQDSTTGKSGTTTGKSGTTTGKSSCRLPDQYTSSKRPESAHASAEPSQPPGNPAPAEPPDAPPPMHPEQIQDEPEPQPSCDRQHPPSEPCRKCGADREARQQWQQRQAEREQQQRQRRRQRINDCDLCDDNGILDLGMRAARCPHDRAQAALLTGLAPEPQESAPAAPTARPALRDLFAQHEQEKRRPTARGKTA